MDLRRLSSLCSSLSGVAVLALLVAGLVTAAGQAPKKPAPAAPSQTGRGAGTPCGDELGDAHGLDADGIPRDHDNGVPPDDDYDDRVASDDDRDQPCDGHDDCRGAWGQPRPPLRTQRPRARPARSRE